MSNAVTDQQTSQPTESGSKTNSSSDLSYRELLNRRANDLLLGAGAKSVEQWWNEPHVRLDGFTPSHVLTNMNITDAALMIMDAARMSAGNGAAFRLV